MKFAAVALLLPFAAAYPQCSDEQGSKYPHLCSMVAKAEENAEGFADYLYKESEKFGTVHPGWEVDVSRKLELSGSLPIVTAHGMGDSCFNSGMKSITKSAGLKVGAYSVCIPTGDSRISDTINGFLLNMDASVDVFAEKVRADPNLANGFNAFGLSQGNNVIRGYIQKYNVSPNSTNPHTALTPNQTAKC